MTDLIPAQPGWYLEEANEEGITELVPIIAWKAGQDADLDDVLLPYVSGGHGFPAILMNLSAFEYCNRRIVYAPLRIHAEPEVAP
ncbi:hypothetical protein ACGFMM_11150 [Streptomyces sp. NPDC048604]|uniref:hypothetical protein n=1 Tax=Streptomyces sp. NPDC048604 TaxID=3365578 RepID=UPI003724019B